jgi:hypothetical protein
MAVPAQELYRKDLRLFSRYMIRLFLIGINVVLFIINPRSVIVWLNITVAGFLFLVMLPSPAASPAVFANGVRFPLSLWRRLFLGQPAFLAYDDFARIEPIRAPRTAEITGITVVDRFERKYALPGGTLGGDASRVLDLIKAGLGTRWEAMFKGTPTPAIWKKHARYLRRTSREVSLTGLYIFLGASVPPILIFLILVFVVWPGRVEPLGVIQIFVGILGVAVQGIALYFMQNTQGTRAARKAVEDLLLNGRKDEVPPDILELYERNIRTRWKWGELLYGPKTVTLHDPVRCPECGKAFTAEYHAMAGTAEATVYCPFCWKPFIVGVTRQRLEFEVRKRPWNPRIRELLSDPPSGRPYTKLNPLKRGSSTYSNEEVRSMVNSVRTKRTMHNRTFGMFILSIIMIFAVFFGLLVFADLGGPAMSYGIFVFAFLFASGMSLIILVPDKSAENACALYRFHCYEGGNGLDITPDDTPSGITSDEADAYGTVLEVHDYMGDRIVLSAEDAGRELELGALPAGAAARIDAGKGRGIGMMRLRGRLEVRGDAGDLLGMCNLGGDIDVDGCAGEGAGRNMVAGRVVVRGDAGNMAGALMQGGTLVITGNAGEGLGTWMTGGRILVAGPPEKLGDNAGLAPMGDRDRSELEGLGLDPARFKKVAPLRPGPGELPLALRKKAFFLPDESKGAPA